MSKEESIEQQAYNLLNKRFLGWREVPASISGRFHGNESMDLHIKHTVSVTKHLCDCYDIQGEDRDLLVASAVLHDMGKFVISTPSKIMIPGWRYYPQTDYSRIEGLYKIHGPVGAAVLDDYKIDRKDELKAIVASHMHRFAPDAPQPITLYQHIICLADYIATMSSWDQLLNYQQVEDKNGKK
jgi:HD superfamily phosphohydrolase YqeK